MRVWLDIWDPTYSQKLGDGPIFVRSASIRRGLDETGSGSADLNGVDPRVVALLAPRRICEIWVHEDGFSKRRVGSFVIENDTNTLASGNNTRGVSGRTSMVELANKIVLPGLAYSEQTVENVVEDLCALAGWTVDIPASVGNQLISVPFGGGENVLKALQTITQIKGVHLRESSVAQQVEIGAFGEDAGVWIEYIEGDGGEIHRRSTSPLLIEQLAVVEESSDIFNYALGFAGGSGDAAIDLGLSTRSFVDAVSGNGRLHYVIRDNASIGRYGQIERRVDAKRIVPTDNTDAALQYAADAAADAIKAKLDRYSEPQEVLMLTLRNVRATIQPGDKIHLTYQGMTNKQHVPYKYRDIDADFWVMKVTEVIRTDGAAVQITISNIDRYMTDAAGVLVGMVDAIQVQEIDVQPYPASYPWGPFQQPIDTDTDVTFQFPIFDTVLRLNSVKAYILRDVWTAVAGTAAAGGDHRHLVAEHLGAEPLSGVPMSAMEYEFAALDGDTALTTKLAAQTAADWWTRGASGDHTHDTEFSAVQKDNQKPQDVTLVVNGVEVATGLFPSSGGDDVVSQDITDAVLGKAGGYRGWHEIDVSCGGGRGDISVVFLIDADLGKVRKS